ncbi:ABC transporter ATP-binding protein [Aggregatilinea lenta]|uniref:ABC transporter ATP-binding protein n=1 Tax=Aggregatilinea lenta TaxID=913108 RepID=UPI0013C2CAC7|nr:ABC transporter ATP-binding protein [Aggregatilinea lenta]
MANNASNGTGQPYINCTNVVKAYTVGDHEIVALRGIDFTMAPGEMVAIVGPSGAGKSSLLNLLGGLDTPTAGRLTVGDINLIDLKRQKLAEYRLRQVGFVWQQVGRNLLPHRSALRNVMLPMMLAGIGWRERRARAQELVAAVGMAEHAHKRPSQLSGGQQQRVAMAVALANHPQLLLADELTGALDRVSAIQVMQLIADLRQRYGLTILMVTHDMEVAAFADRVLTLRDGALGQHMTEAGEEAAPSLDGEGRIRLPVAVRSQLDDAARITVEIRPEGVLLRPEHEAADDTDAVLQDILPQKDGHRRGRRFWRNGRSKEEVHQ